MFLRRRLSLREEAPDQNKGDTNDETNHCGLDSRDACANGHSHSIGGRSDPIADPVLIADADKKLERGISEAVEGDYEKAIQRFRGVIVEVLRATGKLPAGRP